MKLLNCPICGGEVKGNGDYYECEYCRRQFKDDTLEQAYKELKNSLEGVARGAVEDAFVLERDQELANLRRQLWANTREKYVNSKAIVEICREMKKINPDDFCANFYEVMNDESENSAKVTEFLDKIDTVEAETFLDDIVDFVLKSLKIEYLTSLNALVERAYINDREKYEEVMTKIEAEAEKVKDGVYSLVVPRDVFVAYSSKDMAIVNKLVASLEEQGIECFVAARNLQHGRKAVENYERALETAMDNCKIFLFVSSKNSRSLSCDAIRYEIPYIRKKDLEFKPEYRNDYGKMPEKYRKPRIQYRVDDVKTVATDKLIKEFFGELQWRSNIDSVVAQVGEYLSRDIEEVAFETVARPQEEQKNAYDEEALYVKFRDRIKAEEAQKPKETKKPEVQKAENFIENLIGKNNYFQNTKTQTKTQTKPSYTVANEKTSYSIGNEPTEECNKWVALLLCYFLGIFGVHRFYEGDKKWGKIYLFTLGLFFYGWLFDLVRILLKPKTYPKMKN